MYPTVALYGNKSIGLWKNLLKALKNPVVTQCLCNVSGSDVSKVIVRETAKRDAMREFHDVK